MSISRTAFLVFTSLVSFVPFACWRTRIVVKSSAKCLSISRPNISPILISVAPQRIESMRSTGADSPDYFNEVDLTDPEGEVYALPATSEQGTVVESSLYLNPSHSHS